MRLGGPALADLDRRIEGRGKPTAPRAEFGYHSGIEPTPDRAKWVQVDLGRSARLDRVVLWGAHDDFNDIGAGFGFPVRFKVELSRTTPSSGRRCTTIADQTGADVPNPGVSPQSFPAGREVGPVRASDGDEARPSAKRFHLRPGRTRSVRRRRQEPRRRVGRLGPRLDRGPPALAHGPTSPTATPPAAARSSDDPDRLREERRTRCSSRTVDPNTLRALAEVTRRSPRSTPRSRRSRPTAWSTPARSTTAAPRRSGGPVRTAASPGRSTSSAGAT